MTVWLNARLNSSLSYFSSFGIADLCLEDSHCLVHFKLGSATRRPVGSLKSLLTIEFSSIRFLANSCC